MRLRSACWLFAVGLVAGCASSTSAPDSGGGNSAVTTTEGTGVFPMIAAAPAGIMHDAAEAETQSDHLDRLCETLPIAQALAARRPNATGCVRALGPPEFWRAE